MHIYMYPSGLEKVHCLHLYFLLSLFSLTYSRFLLTLPSPEARVTMALFPFQSKTNYKPAIPINLKQCLGFAIGGGLY